MKIKARFFALFRELTGKGVEEFSVRTPMTAGLFKDEVVRRYPALGDYFEHVTMAVNAEYAGADAPLKEGDEVAFFPPLSGGQNSGPQAPTRRSATPGSGRGG